MLINENKYAELDKFEFSCNLKIVEIDISITKFEVNHNFTNYFLFSVLVITINDRYF